MSKTLRIGVVGAGANTRLRHLPGFKAISGVELAVVSNRSRASGEKVAAEFGIGRVADTWREVVEAADVDAICVGTWPNLHARVTTAALRAGKHVLTEARMARNLAEAEAMLAESQAHPQLVTQIVPAPMSLPFDATIGAMLREGELGDVREVCVTCTGAGNADAAAPLTWRQDGNLSGRNTMFMGIYYEMVLRWLECEPKAVVANAAVFTPLRRDAEGREQPVTIPESLTILGSYDAAPDVAAGARLIAHFSGVELGAPRNEIRLNGSRAGLRLDLTKGELWHAALGQPERLVEIPESRRGGWRVEADFVESIRDRKPVRLTDFATGVKYMRFTEAVWESWNKGGSRVAL